MHARGVGAYGTFTSYGNWSNITAANFLSAEGKQTDTFVRFSTVQGFRGSPDTVRDMHGFATRFYTDEGNYGKPAPSQSFDPPDIDRLNETDIVGVTVPTFFIQDASQFPDLVHAIKPEPQTEMPQGGTAHTTAYDFFSSQPSTFHTVLWFMAGHGIPRSFRHVNGYAVHAYRFVTNAGDSVYVRIQWRSLQGVASMVWEEAQAAAGKNFDYHRQDLYNAIDQGHYPGYELGVQIVPESDALAYGFDILDPTKYLSEDVVPVTWLGKMELNRNVVNYFAETEQIGFQPGHLVRGIDFSEDPLLQGRIYSYLDTQLQRHGSANFEQLPINRPRPIVHNNNRDGFMQSTIPTNQHAYTPNTLNGGSPMQANQTIGNGFFTSPDRFYSGNLVREQSPTFNDHYTQPRLFWNSLVPEEQQMVVNALRFEVSHVTEESVIQNVVTQLNMIDNDLACRVGAALHIPCPAPNPTFYHNNKTVGVSAFQPLYNISGLQVAFLASQANPASLIQGMQLAESLAPAQVDVTIISETLQNANATYSATDGSLYDAVIVADGIQNLFSPSSFTKQPNSTLDMPKTVSPYSSLFPAGRPLQILVDAFKYGKTVGALGSGHSALATAGIASNVPGVYLAQGISSSFISDLRSALTTFKWLNRFALDSN